MRALARRAALVAAASALATVLFAPAAHADSLVYMNGGNVFISHGDGSIPRQVTGGPNTWSWPTEDDGGNILVAGGQESINAGVEDSAGSQIYRINQQGANLSSPQQTPGSMSTVGCITYAPVSLRVAPNGQHYAYHTFMCDRFDTFVGTVGGAGFTDDDYMQDFMFPSWYGNSGFLISRHGVQLSTCNTSNGENCEWWTHDLGDVANNGWPWFSDETSTESGFDGLAISRDGSKFASIEDDGSDWSGADAHNVQLKLWSGSGPPTNANGGTAIAPTLKCTLTLPADPQATLWYYNAGPSFSPDGTRIALAEPDGVHIANVSNLNNCASITAPLVIPGATQPFWSAADESANAGYVAPNPIPPKPIRDTTAPTIGAPTIRPKRFAVAKQATAVRARKRSPKGAMVRYTLSEPGRVTFTVQRSTKGRKKGHRCVKPSKRLRHARPCTRYLRAGTLTRSGQSGANQLGFSGRIGRKKLSTGSYRIVIRAMDAAGNRSKTKTVRFTIVRR